MNFSIHFMQLFKKIAVVLCLFSAVQSGFGQNLVPNPSFEDTAYCPVGDSDMNAVKNWFPGTIPSADYFNACESSDWASVPQNFIGNQAARTGNGYCGVYTYTPFMSPDTSYREYIEIRLSEPLTNGYLYHLEFYVSLSDSCNYANGIGAYVSNDSIFSGSMTNLSYVPQVVTSFGNPIIDRNNWIKVNGSYTASGGELFLLIGNFETNVSTDTVFVPNGGDLFNFDYNAAYYYIDDVNLYSDSLNSLTENAFSVLFEAYPNPSSSGFVTVKINSLTDDFELKVYNLLGEFISIDTSNGSLKTVFLNKGTYIFECTTSYKSVRKKVLIL